MEYRLPASGVPGPCAPIFIFLVDVALTHEDLVDECAAVAQAAALLPEDARVGLITYGQLVTLYELAAAGDTAAGCPRAWVFRGDAATDEAAAVAAYAPERIHSQLGILPSGVAARAHRSSVTGAPLGAHAMAGAGGGSGVSRFLAPLCECEFALQEALQQLVEDPLPSEPHLKRPARCTGAALAVATALLEGGVQQHAGARLLLYTGGPATVGPATVVAMQRTEELRSHKDFDKGTARHWASAVAFYARIGERLAQCNACVDVLACGLDQAGLAELKSCVEPTGGYAIMAETFRSDNLHASVARLLEREHSGGGRLALCGCGTLEVFTTKEVRTAGALGAACPTPGAKSPPGNVAEVELGMGGTTSWRLCSLSPTTSIAVFFDVVNTHANPLPEGSPFYLQFCTTFTCSDGSRHMRCVTIARAWAPTASSPSVRAGFDQEAAAVALARLATFKAEHEEGFDPLRWLDRSLIRLCSKFGDYTPDEPRSLSLGPGFSYLPQFMFNLRRSPLLQVFNNSPDETAFFRLALAREGVRESLLMIQPVVQAYSLDVPLDAGPQPVALDVSSITPERVLLLDSFFTVVVHTGATLAAWRKAGYAEQPEHSALAALLRSPLEEAKAIVHSRCPTSRLVVCDQGGSQARFLLARLNPSTTHMTAPDVAGGGELIYTEDVSLEGAYTALCPLWLCSSLSHLTPLSAPPVRTRPQSSCSTCPSWPLQAEEKQAHHVDFYTTCVTSLRSLAAACTSTLGSAHSWRSASSASRSATYALAVSIPWGGIGRGVREGLRLDSAHGGLTIIIICCCACRSFTFVASPSTSCSSPLMPKTLRKYQLRLLTYVTSSPCRSTPRCSISRNRCVSGNGTLATTKPLKK